MPLNDSVAPANTGTSRRTVIRTAAWTVPVVSVAAASPAFAASPTGALALDNTTLRPAWSGMRNPALTSQGWFRIQNLAITNNGPDALPAGLLQVVITFPSAWGTVTGYSPNRPWPAGYTWSSTGNTLTIVAGDTVGAIPAGGVLNIADLQGEGGDGDDLWFNTSTTSGGLGLNNMIATVSVRGTSATFTGASRAASVATVIFDRVWTTLS